MSISQLSSGQNCSLAVDRAEPRPWLPAANSVPDPTSFFATDLGGTGANFFLKPFQWLEVMDRFF